jgi:hypothetical protein
MSTLTMPLSPLRPIKRLTRPAQVQGFVCTDRDLEILTLSARFRFLTSEQTIRFFEGLTAHEYAETLRTKPWAFQVYLRRLYLLWAHGFLVRPDRQRSDVIAFGNAPIITGITRKSAMLLHERGMHVDVDLDWAALQRHSHPFLMHTVATAEAVLAFELSCRRMGTLKLIDHDALLSDMPTSTRAMPRPLALRVPLSATDSILVIPDRLIGLQKDDSETETDAESERKVVRRLLAIELDRGTLTIKRFTRRLFGYHAAWRADLHERQWGSKSLRVCTIAPSLQRVENMIAAQEDALNGGSNLFVFSTPEMLAEHGALGASWITGKRETVSLLGD